MSWCLERRGISLPNPVLLASIDILWSTFIVNAVVLISLTRDRGFKKSKWKWEVIATGEEAGGSGGRLRKVQVGWDATQGDWKNDVKIIAGRDVDKLDIQSKSGKWSKNSLHSDDKSDGDESIELRDLGKEDEEGIVRMEGVERPERARLLGEIRVARQWESNRLKFFFLSL
ncbi:hypothetical protein M7I_7188 [Glarea lozoyensis 74030]|uniref:Uncharacterized protein n=1 Tax=Glarea lozoyensis (strain ATCC 74030 / MF5533) TaxID=1104152 RepID=H0EWL8_GLAL7|nr:hypothetical protein M7I_7188 [Glarea lozoyensis 74030]